MTSLEGNTNGKISLVKKHHLSISNVNDEISLVINLSTYEIY